MDAPVRVALVGYGLAGRVFHAPLLTAEPGLHLAAVVTSDRARAGQARADLPDIEVVADLDALWRDAEAYDLVVVAVANVAHEAVVAAALGHGLHVVVDKPMARDATSAEALATLARRQQRQLHVFQNRRWDSDFRTLCALVEEGRLGSVHRLESRFERWRPEPTGAWRESPDPAQMGGLLYDLGAHLVDQALALLGPAERVYAETASLRAAEAADDDVFVALRHRSGAISHLWASAVAAHPGPRFRALGSAGAYVIDGLDSQEERLQAGERPGPTWGEEPSDRWGRLLPSGDTVRTLPGAWPEYYRRVVASLRGDGPPPVDLDGVIQALRVLDAARESARLGAVVPLATHAT
jgi:predicted dehydrogenase